MSFLASLFLLLLLFLDERIVAEQERLHSEAWEAEEAVAWKAKEIAALVAYAACLHQQLDFLVGILGGFTTFSSFAVQTFNLMRDGEFFLAGVNLVVSNVAGLILVWAGYSVSRSL